MRAASILLAVVIAIAGVTYWFTVKDPIQKHMKLGLDLKGGVHMVLEGVDDPELGPVTSEKIKMAKEVIENRIQKGLNLAEPVIQIDSKNRIVVEIADVQDTDRAREMIGATAVLKFVDPEGNTVLDGRDIEKAGVANSPSQGGYVVTLRLKGEGPKKFADATTRFVGQPITISLDDQVISDPVVQGPITTGEAIITGNFTPESASDLANLINGGALPVKLELRENRVVTTTLGADSIARSAKAGAFGLAGILVFLLAVYRLPGLLASLALFVYTMLTLGFLIGVNATFTLPGLAALLLSMGMAIDGNVIIFERIKEELRAGKGLRSGIDAGFHRAFAAIWDGQLTTAIAGGVLYFLGTGPIKGFAVTLVVGVVLSLFTSITVSRWLINLTVATGWFDKRLFGVREVKQA